MSTVKLIMFNNGLQLMGVYEKKDEAANSVVISKPVQLVMLPQNSPQAKEGQVGMAFAPFLQYTQEWKDGVTFMVSDVLTVTTPLVELLNSYNVSFGTGLVVPDSKLV